MPIKLKDNNNAHKITTSKIRLRDPEEDLYEDDHEEPLFPFSADVLMPGTCGVVGKHTRCCLQAHVVRSTERPAMECRDGSNYRTE